MDISRNKIENKNKSQFNLKEKNFKIRDSLLNELLLRKHIRPIYYFFCMSLAVLVLRSMCRDYKREGRFYFGVLTIQKGFAGLHHAFRCWLLLHIIVFSVFFGFKFWSTLKFTLLAKHRLNSLLNHCSLIIYINCQLVCIYLAGTCCSYYDLPFGSAAALLMEMFRLLMKMHAFVRSNAPAIMKAKVKQELPLLKTFLYFLFAPTLIYREKYPRLTKRIRWWFIVKCILEIVAITFVYAFVFEQFIDEYFYDFGRDKLDFISISEHFISIIPLACIIHYSLFYLVLHDVQNIFAELLHFGDRLFYSDWWNSSIYEDFHRYWNIVVYDWFFEYIYKDLYIYVFHDSRLLAKQAAFVLSALAHEMLFVLGLRIFLPIQFFLYIFIGTVVSFLLRRSPTYIGNAFVITIYPLGVLYMICFYSMEFYAKQNCPKVYNSFVDYLIPNIWTCYMKYK